MRSRERRRIGPELPALFQAIRERFAFSTTWEDTSRSDFLPILRVAKRSGLPRTQIVSSPRGVLNSRLTSICLHQRDKRAPKTLRHSAIGKRYVLGMTPKMLEADHLTTSVGIRKHAVLVIAEGASSFSRIRILHRALPSLRSVDSLPLVGVESTSHSIESMHPLSGLSSRVPLVCSSPSRLFWFRKLSYRRHSPPRVARHFRARCTEKQSHQRFAHLEYVIDIDQVHRRLTSNPATYTVFHADRELSLSPRPRFAVCPGTFSFNVNGGLCAACELRRARQNEMHSCPYVYVPSILPRHLFTETLRRRSSDAHATARSHCR